MKKSVYIHGSFMNDNYGDFLLYYMASNICDRYTNLFDFFSADVDESYDNYCKINRKNKMDGIFKSELVLFAGGGYFGEPDRRKLYWNVRCFIKHLVPAYIISKRKIPYAIIGVETGPISSFVNKKILKSVCQNASTLSVRNEESKKFLENIGVNREILVNPDWIMGIDAIDLLNHKNNADSILNDIDSCKKKIFVHLTTRNKDGMENVISDLKEFLSLRDDICYIIGTDQKRESQSERAKSLYQSLGDSKCKLALYNDPWTLSVLLNKVDAVITDKLHVGIVATKFNKEVISVASHTKTLKYFKLIGRENFSTHLINIKSKETLEKLNSLTFKDISIKEEVFINAKKNEKLLVKFLDDHNGK